MNQKILENLYKNNRLSSKEIANSIGCSTSKVDYWLRKFNISKRSISEAIYSKKNRLKIPYVQSKITNINKSFLFGLGIGLYWGEGTKRSKNSVRLGNSDPKLIKKFIEFLEIIYCVDRASLKFGLQIFGDVDVNKAIEFWIRELDVLPEQFYKPIMSKIRGEGTYKSKAKFGVLTMYFNNTKLRNILCFEIEKLSIM